MSAPDVRIRVTSHLSDQEVRAALALAEESARADGAYPLSEHVVLHLRHGDSGSLHLLAEQHGTPVLLGYAHLDVSDAAEGPSAELAVSPTVRRQGVGGMLVRELVSLSDPHPGRLRLWAHGADAAANELASAHGFHRVRRLWQLRRSLFAPLDPGAIPEGITLRSFDAQRDIPGWLTLNAAAFADLADQGGWTREDLERRMAEPWFDPSGFLMAEATDGRLVGFHWTKVHSHGHGHHPPGDHEHTSHGVHEPIGEVYVLGVDPGMRGQGLGRSLTLAGLHHLRRQGLASALLYVDADNVSAISLYKALGFAAWDSDTLFRR